MDKTSPQSLASLRSDIMAGDAARIAKQHEGGKYTARERINKLFDAGSFVETDTLKRDAHVVTGYGTVHGRAAYCFAQDFTSLGGAMTAAQAEKILKVLRMAQMTGAPVIALCDSAGMSLAQGAAAMAAYAQVLGAMTRLSGVCPLLCCISGECKGVATLLSQVSDITIQVEKVGELSAHAALVMNAAQKKSLTAQELFGAKAMAAQGAVALTAANEEAAISLLIGLLDILPGCNAEDAPLSEGDDLNRLVAAKDAADTLPLAAEMMDGGRYIELFAAYGKALHTLLGVVGGRPVGIVASEYALDNGRLDVDSCKKAARFVRFCDCYSLPVISLIHSDGLAVPAFEAQAAQMTAAAQLLYAYGEATCPKVAVITGHAIGAAYVSMGGKAIADITYAWPDAVIAPLTQEVAVQTLNTAELLAGEKREDLEANYAARFGALSAAQEGLLDDVIEPSQTRQLIIAALELLAAKHDVHLPRKHGNLPL